MSAEIRGILFRGIRPTLVRVVIPDYESREYQAISKDPFGVDDVVLADVLVSSTPASTSFAVRKTWERTAPSVGMLDTKSNSARLPGTYLRVQHNGRR